MEKVEFVNAIKAVVEQNYGGTLEVVLTNDVSGLYEDETGIRTLGTHRGLFDEKGLYSKIELDATLEDGQFKSIFVHEIGHYIGFMKEHGWLNTADQNMMCVLLEDEDEDIWLHPYESVCAAIYEQYIRVKDRDDNDIAQLEVEDAEHAKEFAKLLASVGAIDYNVFLEEQIEVLACYRGYLNVSEDMGMKLDKSIEMHQQELHAVALSV